MYFHFGWDGSGSENRKNPKVQGKNALDGMKALEGARKLGCKRFLFSGSQAEYGICADTMGETRACHPVSEYGKAKIAFGRNATEKVRQWNQAGVCRMEYVHTGSLVVMGRETTVLIGEYLRGSLFAGRRDGVWSLHPAVEFFVY